MICGREHNNLKTVYIGVNPDEYDEEKINVEECKELVQYKEKYEDKKVLLYLARIVEEKRPIFAIHVLKELCKHRDDIVLFVVGSGMELDEMKRVAKEFKLEEHVIFFGMQNDTKPFYKVADAHIICSLTEGLTITTYESLAMGTPVITADVGGQKELVDDSCGAVVQNIQNAKDDFYNREYTKEEIERYVTAIERVIDNPKYEQIKENCRKKILNGFNIENMVRVMDQEFTTFAKEGSKVNKAWIENNKEIYRQYLVLFNQIDQRVYNPEEGGFGERVEAYSSDMSMLKSKLWKNPIWRGFVKFLQKTGLMKLIKKSKMDRALKNAVKKMV